MNEASFSYEMIMGKKDFIPRFFKLYIRRLRLKHLKQSMVQDQKTKGLHFNQRNLTLIRRKKSSL